MDTSSEVLTGYVILGVLGFGLRTLFQWYRTGSSGWRLFVGKESAAARAYELVIAAALLCLLASPLAVRAELVQPWWQASPSLRLIAGVWFLAATVLMLVAQFEMGSAWRVGVDER